MPDIPMYEMYCPRCDRKYAGPGYDKVLAMVKEHVSLQHPDHDPNWAEDGV